MSELQQLIQAWRTKAIASREEAGRIRHTIKEATDAEERCNVRSEVWEQCVEELMAAMDVKGGGMTAKCPVCHIAIYDDAAKAGYCTNHEPKGSAAKGGVTA